MEQMAFKFGILSVSIHSPASRVFHNTLRNGQLRTAGMKFGQTLSSSFAIISNNFAKIKESPFVKIWNIHNDH
ncbi:hypothetical protein T06_9126 [Trichinella sp. T6]|nr:hypothetical protein T06_9126 [Trichinella sp. T6]